MTLTPEIIAELEMLDRVSTPGPWTAHHAPRMPPEVHGPEGECSIALWPGFDDCDRPVEGHMLNVSLIAAMRNAIPALLAAVRERDRLLDTIRSVLDDDAKYPQLRLNPHTRDILRRAATDAAGAMGGAE